MRVPKWITILFVVVLVVLVVVVIALMLYSSRPPQDHLGNYVHETGSLEPINWCSIVVVVDNNPGNGLETAWGLSILVKTPDIKILFDTGPDPMVLRNNMEALGIDPRDIDAIVISHEHSDHVGGLGYIAEVNPGLRVYVPSGMSRPIKESIQSMGFKVVEIDRTTVIGNGVAVIGQLHGPPWEQALAVYVKGKGLIVVVGCSHPGVDKIVSKAINDLGVHVYMVIGGFHMAGSPPGRCRSVVEKLISYGVEYIVPIHCSGNTIRSILSNDYPEHFMEAHVGSRITV